MTIALCKALTLMVLRADTVDTAVENLGRRR